MSTSSERGHDRCDPVDNPAACVFHLVTPAVRQAARNHFGCPTLRGAELENQPTTGGVLGSHWEMRLFLGEFMSPIALLTPYVSQVRRTEIQLRIRRRGFGTGRQRMVLERGTNPKRSRRTCTCEYGLQSWRGKSAGVAKRPRELISHP